MGALIRPIAVTIGVLIIGCVLHLISPSTRSPIGTNVLMAVSILLLAGAISAAAYASSYRPKGAPPIAITIAQIVLVGLGGIALALSLGAVQDVALRTPRLVMSASAVSWYHWLPLAAALLLLAAVCGAARSFDRQSDGKGG